MHEALFRFAQENSLTIQRLEQKKETLEEIFQQLTRADHESSRQLNQ
ncbi:MAG: hypothetical protein AAF392_03380 [Bacteroidota bacterium]